MEELKKQRTKIEDGELIWLSLNDMGIKIVPDSITKLDIKTNLFLLNNPINTLPKNFNTIRVGGRIHYNNKGSEDSNKIILDTIILLDEKKLLALTPEEQQRIKT